ncbi:hypothetical protein VTK26DRAFT_5773 [Humicola hyalothermophila]
MQCHLQNRYAFRHKSNAVLANLKYTNVSWAHTNWARHPSLAKTPFLLHNTFWFLLPLENHVTIPCLPGNILLASTPLDKGYQCKTQLP